MTDAEREAQIRHHVAQVQAMAPYDAENVQGHVTFLFHRLDEARAEIARLSAERDRVGDFLESILEPMPPLGDSRRPGARLQAPPGAAAMEQARYLALAITKLPASEALPSWWAGDVAPIMARAIERAKSETARLYLGWCELCQVYHRTGNCGKTEQPPSKEARESWSALPEKDWPVIRRWLDEARTKAIEEAAHFHAQQPGNPDMRKIEAEAIRALAKP